MGFHPPLLALLLSGCAVGRAPLRDGPVCRPADALTSGTLDHLKGMVTSTDSTERAYRDSVKIPEADSASVHLVTDEQTCRRAAKAYNALWKTPERPRQVY